MQPGAQSAGAAAMEELQRACAQLARQGIQAEQGADDDTGSLDREQLEWRRQKRDRDRETRELLDERQRAVADAQNLHRLQRRREYRALHNKV